MRAWRLIESPPAPGDWNMAADSALLDSVVESGACCLRFYSWSAPTLSLGYFQHHADRAVHAASSDCALVRRSTGGGAIVHDREITYSFVVPAADPMAGSSRHLYHLMHESLIAALGEWRLAAVMAGRAPSPRVSAEPFLCFCRRAEGDVLIGDRKVAGSAQRRRRGVVLQHGSVLLNRSSAAPELPGIADLGGVAIKAGDLCSAWRERLAKQCGISWQPEPLAPDEIKRADRLVEEVYSQTAWTLRR